MEESGVPGGGDRGHLGGRHEQHRARGRREGPAPAAGDNVDGRALLRPGGQDRRVPATTPSSTTATGPSPPSGGFRRRSGSRRTSPRSTEKPGHICDCGDWLIHRLTGEWASSINFASSKYYYDRDEGGFPESLYDAVDAGDLLEKFPQDVLDLGTVAGELSKEAAEELGLKAGTPVAEGGVDAYVGALGLGVVEPGKMALITGSSHVMIGQTAEAHPRPRLLGRLHGRHDPRPVHRRGRAGLDRLHRRLVQEPVRRRRGGRGQRARRGHLRRPDRAGARRAHRFRRADSARLLPGQPFALHRPPGARHDVGPDPEPHAGARVPRHHRGHLLRHGEHPAHHARAGLRAEAQRRLRRPGQERPLDADARRRLQRADLLHAG